MPDQADRANRFSHSIAERSLSSPAQFEREFAILPATSPCPANVSSMEERQSVSGIVDHERASSTEAQSWPPLDSSKPNPRTDLDWREDDLLSPKSPMQPHNEWIPFMLRKRSAFSLAIVLVALVAILEFLGRLEQRM